MRCEGRGGGDREGGGLAERETHQGRLSVDVRNDRRVPCCVCERMYVLRVALWGRRRGKRRER